MLMLAWEQSGLAETSKDTSWFYDPQLREIALHVLEGQNGLTKKFGGHLVLTHVLRVADFAYNFPDGASPEQRKRRAAKGLMHDDADDRRDAAQKRGLPFSKSESVMQQAYLKLLWNDEATWPEIQRCNDYMWDSADLSHIPEKKARHAARIKIQIDKSFDPVTGACIIDEDCQIIRGADKIEQGLGDLALRKAGLLPDDKLKAQYDKMREKQFPFDFPVFKAHPEFKRQYDAAIAEMAVDLDLAETKNRQLAEAVQARLAHKLTGKKVAEALQAQDTINVIALRPDLAEQYKTNLIHLQCAAAIIEHRAYHRPVVALRPNVVDDENKVTIVPLAVKGNNNGLRRKFAARLAAAANAASIL